NTLPPASQERQILATWGPLVPNPVFDYAYSWGTQNSDQALEGSTTLQAVFSAHNATSAGPRDRGIAHDHARRHLGHLLRSEWTSFQLVAPVVTVTSSSPMSRSPRLGSYDAVPADRSRR